MATKKSKTATRFTGSYVALVTPFKKGKVDFDAFQKLVEWHIASGTHGLVPCGTTGETPTLSVEEHKSLIVACVEAAAGRVPVIAGAGSNATDKSVELGRFAEKSGADGILVVTPYYNKPTQEGMYQHYKAVNDAQGLPVILYNVPGRTGVEISVETVVRLAALKRIAGIKDASVDLSRPLQIRRALGDDFIQLSGEDGTVAAYLAQGGHGCISVTANVAPKLCADLHNAWQKKDWKKFEKLRDQLLPLHKHLFAETNPSPAKYCLTRLGKIGPDMRLPMLPVSKATEKLLDGAMKDVGLKVKK
ncbi:MAG: 4-hydroxy-tetrahydrodipicolinate synthase [Bdellovibrionales bacterium]|jgi:4-hydroxy-tetrahydrodipicolinate synthase|nr:4-hydroxy-tetrahydrodipicolinate synthase [Bdellovibrionales bacterium]